MDKWKVYNHTKEFYSVKKEKKNIKKKKWHTNICYSWTNLEYNMLSEKISYKSPHIFIPFIWDVQDKQRHKAVQQFPRSGGVTANRYKNFSLEWWTYFKTD